MRVDLSEKENLATRLIRKHASEALKVAQEYAAVHNRLGRSSYNEDWLEIAELIRSLGSDQEPNRDF